MGDILGDDKAPAYLALAVVLVVMTIAILAVSWKDSRRAMGELLAPLKRNPLKGVRFRFGLRTMFFIMTALAVLLKVAVSMDFWPDKTWLEVMGRLLLGAIVLGMVGFALCTFLATFQPGPKIDQSGQVPADDDELDEIVGKKAKKKHVRFEDKKRPTTRFKW